MELFDRIKEKIIENLKDTLAIIVFGSFVYRGKGKDIDIIIITKNSYDVKKQIEIRMKLNREFNYKYIFDIHIFSLEEFIKNLKPGTFLTGLALGYKIIYDRINVEKYLKEFFKEILKENIIFVNKYGTWNLSFHAKLKLKNLYWT